MEGKPQAWSPETCPTPSSRRQIPPPKDGRRAHSLGRQEMSGEQKVKGQPLLKGKVGGNPRGNSNSNFGGKKDHQKLSNNSNHEREKLKRTIKSGGQQFKNYGGKHQNHSSEEEIKKKQRSKDITRGPLWAWPWSPNTGRTMVAQTMLHARGMVACLGRTRLDAHKFKATPTQLPERLVQTSARTDTSWDRMTFFEGTSDNIRKGNDALKDTMS